MKIDFQGRFEQVGRLVNASSEPASRSGVSAEFRQLLEQAPSQEANNINDSGPRAQLSPTRLASSPPIPSPALAYLPPRSLMPELEPLAPEIVAPEIVNETPPSVKTPTVVEVDRIRESVSESDIKAMITAAGIEHGVDPATSLAVASAESAFRTDAVSKDGHASKGLFQLLDTTGTDLMNRFNISGDYDPFDPELNTRIGIGYLRYLHDIYARPTNLTEARSTSIAENFSSLEKLAVASFNAGEGRVAYAQELAAGNGSHPGRYEDVEPYLPSITQQYVARVMSQRAEFQSELEQESVG